jgi:hypothetical protein
MKFLLLPLLFFICIAKSYGQTASSKSYGNIAVEIIKKKRAVSVKVEITSAFTGGDSAWVQLVERRLNQAFQASEHIKKGTDTVSVSFLIDKYGYFSGAECEKGTSAAICAEVIRAIYASSGRRWGLPRPVMPFQANDTMRRQ